VNKNLWSTSFCLVSAGGGLVGLSLCYLLVDHWQLWTGHPFLPLGMNSILIYCGHSLLAGYMPFSYMLYHVNHGSMLLCAVVGVTSWLLVASYCYHIGFFVKI
jgi:predicted acyltransferase